MAAKSKYGGAPVSISMMVAPTDQMSDAILGIDISITCGLNLISGKAFAVLQMSIPTQIL